MAALDAMHPGTARAARIAHVVRVVVFAAIALCVLKFFWSYGTVRIPAWNDQMAPTLSPGEKVLVHRGKRRASDFSRGEMVVYAVRAADAVELRLGRVAALPGDAVEVRRQGGSPVFVNGEPPAHSPVLLSPPGGPSTPASSEVVPAVVRVPDGAVYVLNDNTLSRLADSRRLGPLAEASLAGKVVMSLAW